MKLLVNFTTKNWVFTKLNTGRYFNPINVLNYGRIKVVRVGLTGKLNFKDMAIDERSSVRLNIEQLRVIFTHRYRIKIRLGLCRTEDCDFSYFFRSRISLDSNLKNLDWIRSLKKHTPLISGMTRR